MNSHRRTYLTLLPAMIAAWIVSPAVLQAELTVASLLTDHAVLQQQMPVPIWGTADPQETVTVEFAGQKKQTTAADDGRWMLDLDAMDASFESRNLTVTSGDEIKDFNDVLVGEVWICAGQSNMQMAAKGVPNLKKLIPAAKNLRRFTVKQTVAFEEQATCQGEWKEAAPDSAVAFSFAYHLEAMTDAPIGIIQTSWGSSSIEGWMPRDLTAKLPHFAKIMKAFDADEKKQERIAALLSQGKWDRKNDIFLRKQPNILYNAMMHPLVPYACRGVVWYQGESNSGTIASMIQYGDSLKAWIKRYRKQWGRDDLEFLIVMLPGYGKMRPNSPSNDVENPSAYSWAWIRESQLVCQSMLQNVEVANTIDLGDVKNIHPKDKLPIGKRLALLAARDVLGMDVEAEGPQAGVIERAGSELIVRFSHAEGLKTTDGKAPIGFWVCDDSRKWFKADAKIEGNTVRLSSEEVSEPKHIRYAFAGKPTVNLVNESGLPAYPFRTGRFEP